MNMVEMLPLKLYTLTLIYMYSKNFKIGKDTLMASEHEISGGIENSSKIIFLISQRKHML